MYMQHLQPQTQNYVNEDSKRIIDKFQTLRSSNQHFKSQSDVKYQSSNQADHQGMQPKPKASDIQGQTTAIQAVLKKQGIQQKPATIPNNQIYQMTGAPTSQRNYLQVGKIDLESILSTNKKQGQVSQAQNYNPPQGIVTQREVNKRQTLPPDRRSFQDQFNTTPQCINNSNLVYNQQQQQPVKQVINSNYNLNSCQSSSTVSKVGSNGLINQNQSAFYQHQQQPSINIIQTSNFQNNSSSSQQYDDLDKYKKQMQQKLVSTTPSKQLLHSYQNQPQTSMHTPKGNNRSQHTSEANILYFKGNVSSQDLVSNQQSRIQSDSQLNLHPSPMKQISTHPNKIIGNDSFQQINQSQNQTFKNLIQNPESQSYLNNSSYKYQKQPASFDNNDFKKQYQQQQQQQQSQQFNNQQNSGQNLLNVKNTQFQYVDQSQALNKNNSNSTSIHNLPNSPQSAGMPGLSKGTQSNLISGQQYYSQVNSVNPSIQNSQAFSQNNCSSNNNNFSNNNTNEKFSYTNTNILNSKTQSIDDILKHLKSKEMSKVQTIPQRIFNSTAQSLSNKSQLINQIGTNKEQLTNYQLTTTTPKEQEIKNELPLNNQIQITSINTITQNEKKVEVKPAVMRQNSDKLQNALTNRTDLFQMSSQNIQNPQNVNTACFNNIFSSSTNDYFFNKMNRNNNDSQKTVISSSINSSELIQPKVSQSGANSLTQQISTQIAKDVPTQNNNKLLNQIDQNNYSIQSQKYMFGSSNISNRIIPNANFTASHTYDKNINSVINQSINNASITISSNNNLVNSIPQNQGVANQSYFSTTLNNSISLNNNNNNQQNFTTTQVNNLSNINLDTSISPIKKIQANQSEYEKKYTEIKQFSTNNSQNQPLSNLSSYYNSPNLQYAHPTIRQNDLSNNSILSSINYAVTSASGLTTNRTNNNQYSAISQTSAVKPLNTSQSQPINEGQQPKDKDNQLYQQSNLSAKRNSEISYQKALDEIKPSEQVEKILDEIRRKNSTGVSVEKQQEQKQPQQQQIQTKNSYEESQLKNSPQITNTPQNQQAKLPNSNLLQSIQNLNLDVKGILQNTISKNISTVSSQYQQLLYRGSLGNNNEFTSNSGNNNNNNTNNQSSQQSVVDKILQEIKRNDMKKHLQSVLTVSSQVNTSGNNITTGNFNNQNDNNNANGTANYSDSTQNILSSSISPYIQNKNDQSNLYNLSAQKNDSDNIIKSQNILEHSSNLQKTSLCLLAGSANQLEIPEKNEHKINITDNIQNSSQNETNSISRKMALENEFNQLQAKHGERKLRLSSFSNKKASHHLDIPSKMEDSDNEGKDSIGSHESFIEERESIQKFSTNCSYLTAEPLRQTKIVILNSIISKDSFKRDDFSASKQPVFSSLSFSQNQVENQNHTPQNKNYEPQIILSEEATQEQNMQAKHEQNNSSKQSSKVPTLVSFSPSLNQISSKNDIVLEEKSNQIKEANSNIQSETKLKLECDATPKIVYGEKDFYFVKKLGKGKHSEVFLAQDKKTGFLFAVKQVHKEDMISMGMEEQFSNEIKIQMSLNHPNIIRLYGFYEDEYYFYLLMEYAPGGEIYRYQKTLPDGRFKETEAAFYLYQLANALRYLHSKNIIHRDIKPENLLISNGVVKLADFGYSRVCDFKSTRSTFCGTLDYLSPQVVKGLQYNHDVDVWAFGVMCYEFIQGVAPFYEKSKDDTLDKIQSGKYSFIKPLSDEARAFIKLLLDSETKNRISMSEVCRSQWLIQNAEIFKQEQGPISEQELANIFK